MKDENSHPGRKRQSRHNANGTERNTTGCCKGNDHLGKRRDLSLAETIDSDNEYPHHHRSKAIEPAAHDRCRTEVRIGEYEREHNAQGREHETEPSKQTSP